MEETVDLANGDEETLRVFNSGMEMECDGPNEQLYAFQGTLSIPSLKKSVGLNND